MVILFKTVKLEKECNNKNLLVKRFGARRANLLKRRLNELQAADTLDLLRCLPQARCHELKGNRKGQLSVDLDHPFRLIFEPADNPIPKKKDGGLDWTKVTKIRVIGVEDTHE
ncbi:MAG: killer suppression protein [Deltaproteobacteria bacterium]|jgi:proteic killer suppression protein|nr:MAG: killer suppression protein [Deltaproteobacteria bacterium]